MPIYEYQCQGCHHEYDLIQKINEQPLKKCPNCSEDKAIRLVSAPSFQLKGTGWYATDYKDKDKPKSENKDKNQDKGKDTQGSSEDKKPVEKTKSTETSSNSTVKTKNGESN